MNAAAKAHLAKAKEYVAKGEQFYRMAAEQILAAQAEDSTLSNREIGEWFGKSDFWVRDVVLRVTNPSERSERYDVRNEASQRATTKKALREKPEIVAELAPEEQRAIARELDEASAKRQKERERISKEKEREHLGDETIDDLELREELQSTEYLLIKARGNLRGFVKNVGEIGIENAPDNWRESCLDWIEDLEGHLGMAKALLAGDNIDWAAFDELLSKEGN